MIPQAIIGKITASVGNATLFLVALLLIGLITTYVRLGHVSTAVQDIQVLLLQQKERTYLHESLLETYKEAVLKRLDDFGYAVSTIPNVPSNTDTTTTTGSERR